MKSSQMENIVKAVLICCPLKGERCQKFAVSYGSRFCSQSLVFMMFLCHSLEVYTLQLSQALHFLYLKCQLLLLKTQLLELCSL